MKLCEKCGREIEPGQKFCHGCGVRLDNNDESPLEENDTTVSLGNIKEPETAKKFISKGWAAVLVIALVLMGGGYFAYQYGQNHYSRTNQIDRLVTVLQSEDYEEIASILTSTDADLDINSETVIPYVDAYIAGANLTAITQSLEMDSDYQSLKLVSNGSYFLLYEKFELELQPAFVTIKTNMADVTLSINDEEVVISDEEDFAYIYGPMVPGVYTFKAVTELEGETLETEEEHSATSSQGQNTAQIDLPIYGLYFTVESNMSDAAVYLNDSQIGSLTNGSEDFGPYGSLEGSTLQLRKEETFGELETTSSSMSNYDGEYYYLTFEESMAIEDAETALWAMYATLSDLTVENNWNQANSLDHFGNYFFEGIAYDELRPFFIEYAERQRENEETIRTTYDTTLTNFEQVSLNEYTVDLEVSYITEYDWELDKEDRIRTFTYTVSLVSDEAVRDTWSQNEELFISGFANEELIFDSHE